MWRLVIVIASALLVTACGGGIGSWEEGIEAQSEVMHDMISVLRDVDDESSAEKAAGKIEALGERLAEISSQLAELPRPDTNEMLDIAQKQRGDMQAFQQDAATQMMKLAQYPVLMDAWMRAMENIR